MKSLYCLFVCLVCSVLVASCGKGVVPEVISEDPEEQGVPDAPEQSGFQPAVRIDLTASDQCVRDASNRIGKDIFGRLYGSDGGKTDVVLSPLSLSLALAMVAEGAAGDTYKQFADCLGWGNTSREETGTFYEKMIAGLVEADKSVHFSSSNSLWAAKDLRLKESFSGTLSKSFETESFSVDFSLPQTLQQINGWCSDKTDGKISRFLDSLDGNTRMVLANVLLFKAPWSVEWKVKKDLDFQGVSGNVKKDYLQASGLFVYRSTDNYDVVGVGYGNGAYEMDLVLPAEGKKIADVLPVLDLGALSSMHFQQVDLSLPKFSAEYSTKELLPTCLKEAGLALPFSAERADFSGISDEKLCISKVLQKTRIDVSENGTEFAAATVFTMAGADSGEAPQIKMMKFNRPFLYLIRETSTNTILLMGTLSE